MPGARGLECWAWTDHGRPVWIEFSGQYSWITSGAPLPSADGWTATGTVGVRPHARFETKLDLGYSESAWPVRFVEAQGAGGFLFGALRSPSLSVTLRQLVVLTPRLTLQAYAQLFTDYGRYSAFRTARGRPGQVIGYGDLAAGGVPSTSPDFQDAAFNLSAVMRWEYRLGSTLFLVFTHQAVGPDDRAPVLWPPGLRRGPARDSLLGKWTWYWSS
jgi:hypothetical protein